MSESNESEKPTGLVISSITSPAEPESQHKPNPSVQDSLESATNGIPALGKNSTRPPHKYALTMTSGSVKISRISESPRLMGSNYRAKTTIKKWTAKSRTNMVARFLSLDFSPLFAGGNRLPIFITLTYPGEWEVVAPTGSAVKRHLKAFVKKFETEKAEQLHAVWKLEFQSRGAPHIHIYTSTAENIDDFRAWLSEAWSQVVNHPNPVQRAMHRHAGTRVDVGKKYITERPSLIAIYFSKHSSPNMAGKKEYQNQPPKIWIEAEDVGRFWGYWKLKPAQVSHEITRSEAVFISRCLRKWHRSKGMTRKVRVWRTNARTQQKTSRWVTRRVDRMKSTSGFAAVPDAIRMAEILSRALTDLRVNEEVQVRNVLKSSRVIQQRQSNRIPIEPRYALYDKGKLNFRAWLDSQIAHSREIAIVETRAPRLFASFAKKIAHVFARIKAKLYRLAPCRKVEDR